MPALTSLTDKELAEILALVNDADSVELKLTVRETARAKTVAALGIDSLDAQMRQVFFFDTPGLALNEAGVAVRARRRQGRKATRSSSCGQWSPRTCRRRSGARTASGSRSTRCPAGTCARPRSRGSLTTRRSAWLAWRRAASRMITGGRLRCTG
jgi:hypothetical protein